VTGCTAADRDGVTLPANPWPRGAGETRTPSYLALSTIQCNAESALCTSLIA
jgi:hypothetical protein